MAKKFFYNRVHNTRRTIINLIIISVCIIGIIICFIVVSNFQGESKNPPEGVLSIRKTTTVEVNEDFSKEIFFSKIENVNLDDVEVTYPDDYSIEKVGTYTVTLKINGQDYTTELEVVDTVMPELKLKEVTITSTDSYKAEDFVASCKDNSNKDCVIEFLQSGTDQDGNTIDYSNYKDAGTYTIKISAKDEAGNQATAETKLTINKKATTPKPETKPTTPVTCKYGDTTYDKDNYIITKDISTDGCAISLDLYKDSNTSAEINKIMESETVRIKKDVEALNLNGTLSLNRKVTAVTNTAGNGIIGYELRITVTVSNKDKSETVVDYKLDNNGKRVFITNPHDLKK